MDPRASSHTEPYHVPPATHHTEPYHVPPPTHPARDAGNPAARYEVTIADTGESYNCAGHQHLLAGMEQLGRKGIPIGCRSGGCGVCKVSILEGQVHALKMSRAQVSAEEEAQGVVLACRARPLSAIRLRVIGKMHKNVCGPAILLTNPPSTP